MAFWEQWKCSSIVRAQFFIIWINNDSVWNRLIDFFRYYSRDFMYNNGVASIRAGLLKKESKGWQNDVCFVHPLMWNAVLKLYYSYLRDITMLEKETGSASRYVFLYLPDFCILTTVYGRIHLRSITTLLAAWPKMVSTLWAQKELMNQVTFI